MIMISACVRDEVTVPPSAIKRAERVWEGRGRERERNMANEGNRKRHMIKRHVKEEDEEKRKRQRKGRGGAREKWSGRKIK